MKASENVSRILEENIEFLPQAEKTGDFEEAIKAAGFGKFNICLLFIIIPVSFAQIAEQTSLSYVVPIAQCDLNLTLEDKGILVSASYTGMILSGFFWGYICDTYGRRKVIIYGYLLNGAFYIISAFSQNYTMLLVIKILSGIIYTGPFSAATSYFSEFHSSANRSRIQLLRGSATGVAVMVLPMIGWAILPHIYEIPITENLKLHSWNIFLAVCSIPSLVAGTACIFLPESPKYLMASGRNSEALTVFKSVYNANTGRRLSSFPVKALTEDKLKNAKTKITEETSLLKNFNQGMRSIKPIFKRPYLVKVVHVCFNAMVLVLGSFALKMWYPQILQAINDVGKTEGGSEVHICKIVDSLANPNISTSSECKVNLDNSSVYLKACIQGAIQLVAFILAGILVSRTGKKPLAVSLSLAAGICPLLIYFITNGIFMVVIFPMIIVFSEISANIALTITMEMFPTAFRTTAVNLHMMIARVGIILGNVLLPVLLKAGCISTLSFVAITIFISVGLTALLPNTDNKALE